MFHRVAPAALLLGAGLFLVSASPALADTSFQYNFSTNGTLNEAGSITQSTSPYWWVNSGAMMKLASSTGQTVQGDLPATNPWRLTYLAANPLDTDNGYHPQNIFRLVSKSIWSNARLEAQFYIAKDNWSTSPNRNQSNGLLLMNRYALDGQTLYYAGIRVDGTAVIKKKYHGTYYTMTQPRIFPGTYVLGGQVNLLPHNEWIGLRSETITNANGSVTVNLYMKRAADASWNLIATAVDDGVKYGNTPPILSGAAGIRTDFMDVQFDTFKADPL